MSLGGCCAFHTDPATAFSPPDTQPPLVDESTEAKKSKWFVSLLERSYLCCATALLSSVGASASGCPCSHVSLLTLLVFHLLLSSLLSAIFSFPLPAFLFTSLFLRSLFFCVFFLIANDNHCEHSLLVNGPTLILS